MLLDVLKIDQLIESDDFHQVLEYPWKRCYMALMRPSERSDMILDNLIFSKENQSFLKENWPLINDLTLIDPFRMGKLLDLLMGSLSIDGDIVECGSYQGGSGILMGLLLKKLDINKKIHLFDSFEGLPSPDETHDKGYRKGQFKSNFENLKLLIKSLDLTDIVFLHKGWFKDTIPKFIENSNSNVSLFHVDCDLYNSTMDCFPLVYPLVTKGGVVVLDDFNDGGRGEKKAVLQTLEEQGEKEIFIVSTAPQTYFIKGNVSKTTQIVIDAGVTYDLSELANHQDYLKWFTDTIEENYYEKIIKFMENTELKDRSILLASTKNIIEEVLDLDNLEITESTQASDIEDWDSIMHVEIIVSIEKFFKVKFKTLEIERFKNVGDIISGVLEKQKN